MKKVPFVFAYLFLASFICYSQSNKKISGKVLGAGGTGLELANVFILKAQDSSLLKVDITANDGSYEIPIQDSATILIRIACDNYNTVFSGPFVVSSGNFHVPDIILEKVIAKLKEVVVSSKRPLIELSGDKLIFNVAGSINATGSTALELLQKSPGVMVDNNDNISIKGISGVKIYVDGRITQLDGKDLGSYLKNISSNDIEAIEIISNPGAKFEASGSAGVINIRLKKNLKQGTNGNTSLTYIQGYTPKFNGSVNLNYRNKHINAFGNIGASKNPNEGTIDLRRGQSDSIYQQIAQQTNDSRSVNVKTGIDFFLSGKQTIGVMATTNVSDDYSSNTSLTKIYDGMSNNVKKLNAQNIIPSSSTNSNINLNYKYADTTGKTLNIDADNGIYRSRSKSWQPNYYSDNNNTILYQNINENYTPTDIDIYSLKVDWEQKAVKGKLGIGGKISNVATSNTLNYYDVIDGQSVLVLEKSNSFKYIEQVSALYVNYSRQNKDVNFQAGLRMENTNSIGDLARANGIKKDDDKVARNYTDLFPSTAIGYKINENNRLNLTYSRRIDRPTYSSLNPFEFKLDELTFRKGNAFLQPQYSNVIELRHAYKGMANFSASYTQTDDFGSFIFDTLNANASYFQQRNVGTKKVFNVSAGANLNVTKWWSSYVNCWWSYLIMDGKIGSTPIKSELPMWGSNIQMAFTLPAEYSVEVSGWVRGPSVSGISIFLQPMGSLDIGAQKQLWNKNATIKLSVTDILYTSIENFKSNINGLGINTMYRGESRTVRLSFSYRFGSAQIAAERQRKSGIEGEKNRIN